jgi:hypothetical protein
MEGSMGHDVMEGLVRQWLHHHRDHAYCSECIARALKQDPALTRTAFNGLAPQHRAYRAGVCDCGKIGFGYGDRTG